MLHLIPDKIAVAPFNENDKTKGGLYIPQQAKTRAKQGIVKFIGSDIKSINIGDLVVFSGYDGQLLLLSATPDEPAERLIIIKEDSITAIIKPGPIEVPGLYFKSAITLNNEIDELQDIISSWLHKQDNHGEGYDTHALTKSIIAAGYTKNQYFPATYELAITIITEALEDSDWAAQFKVKAKEDNQNPFDPNDREDLEEFDRPFRGAAFK